MVTLKRVTHVNLKSCLLQASHCKKSIQDVKNRKNSEEIFQSHEPASVTKVHKNEVLKTY